LLPKHVVVASLRSENHHDEVRIGIAADEVVGTYSVNTEDLLEQAPEKCAAFAIGMFAARRPPGAGDRFAPAARSFFRALVFEFCGDAADCWRGLRGRDLEDGMKSRLSSTIWTLVLLNGVISFVVLGLAFSAGKESGRSVPLDFGSAAGGRCSSPSCWRWPRP